MVVAVAGDNFVGSDGDNGDITSVDDNAGNTYTKAVEFTNGQGSASAGATISIWFCVLSNATTGSNSTRIHWNGTSGSKAFGYRLFTISSGNQIQVAASDVLANDGADAGSLAISGLSSSHRLYIRACAVEANTSNGTVTSTWTQLFTTTGSTGGGSASNMWIQAEYKITTSTGETSDPTTGNVDQASAIVALEEYTPTSNPRRIIIIN